MFSAYFPVVGENVLWCCVFSGMGIHYLDQTVWKYSNSVETAQWTKPCGNNIKDEDISPTAITVNNYIIYALNYF